MTCARWRIRRVAAGDQAVAKGQQKKNKEARKPKKGSAKKIEPVAGRKFGLNLPEPAKKD